MPYGSTTATFIGSKKFQDISADKLQPGDIGLKSKTGGTGGANHVGIYCGKMKDGRVVWLHCTSSSGSSLTGNTEGPMFGVYTNFTYFRRLKKWDKKQRLDIMSKRDRKRGNHVKKHTKILLEAKRQGTGKKDCYGSVGIFSFRCHYRGSYHKKYDGRTRCGIGNGS